MKRALVTGAAGFIGSNLALELERLGWQVAALDDFSSGHFENLRGFTGEVIAADVSRPQDWEGRVGRVCAVFHQAAITDTTVSDPMRMMRVNVEGFRDVLGFALRARARSVVYASSAGVYGPGPCPMRETQAPNPLNIYGFSKTAMERVAAGFAAAHRGVQVTGLRYFNVYGPREAHKKKAASMIWQLYEQMRRGRRPRIFKRGEQYRDQIYVRDIVSANLKALAAGKNGVFNVCTGRGTDFNTIVKALNGVLGTSRQPEYFDNPYPFYQDQTLGDPAAAKKALGFAARWSFSEGVKDYLGGRAAKWLP
ncbi:MAG: NAD-dependent epimerase/dehydratase family protein [Elusimicrobia bacterium]|nr:NAD-dependent epimerase/dehydratase family protein [Elusimicrobiota bacterium]